MLKTRFVSPCCLPRLPKKMSRPLKTHRPFQEGRWCLLHYRCCCLLPCLSRQVTHLDRCQSSNGRTQGPGTVPPICAFFMRDIKEGFLPGFALLAVHPLPLTHWQPSCSSHLGSFVLRYFEQACPPLKYIFFPPFKMYFPPLGPMRILRFWNVPPDNFRRRVGMVLVYVSKKKIHQRSYHHFFFLLLSTKHGRRRSGGSDFDPGVPDLLRRAQAVAAALFVHPTGALGMLGQMEVPVPTRARQAAQMRGVPSTLQVARLRQVPRDRALLVLVVAFHQRPGTAANAEESISIVFRWHAVALLLRGVALLLATNPQRAPEPRHVREHNDAVVRRLGHLVHHADAEQRDHGVVVHLYGVWNVRHRASRHPSMQAIEWLTLPLAMLHRPVQHQRADQNGSQFRQHRRQFVAGIHARVVEHHPRGQNRCTDLHAQAADGLLAVRLGLHDGQDAANRA